MALQQPSAAQDDFFTTFDLLELLSHFTFGYRSAAVLRLRISRAISVAVQPRTTQEIHRRVDFVLRCLVIDPIVVVDACTRAGRDPRRWECVGCSSQPDTLYSGCLTCGAPLVPRGLDVDDQVAVARGSRWYDGDTGAYHEPDASA